MSIHAMSSDAEPPRPRMRTERRIPRPDGATARHGVRLPGRVYVRIGGEPL